MHDPALPAAPALREPGFAGLSHIPGKPWYVVSVLETLRLLRDPVGVAQRNRAKYGPVYRNNDFGSWNVVLCSPEANELVFLNKDRTFSSELGWGQLLDRLFPRGLMLLDFDEHRLHRKALAVAFRPEPMARYFDELDAGISRGVAAWPDTFLLYPAVKALTLDLAATSFLAVALGPEADAINRAFVDLVQASVAIVRYPLPGTQMGRGVRGRALLVDWFAREIPKRRGKEGADFFTQFCNTQGDDGAPLTDREVTDHMIFLMMAAHDTITSSLTSTLYLLAKHPEQQEWVREELLANTLSFETLGAFERVEMAFKESLRLYAPVPALPRRALREFTFEGHTIPAGTQVGIQPMTTHRLPEIWPDPDRFDPMRFSPENVKGRHKFAWVPFGGGAHMCLGMQFAYMQVKTFLYRLLTERRVSLPDGYEANFQVFPMPKPRDGLPVRLARV